MKIEKFQTAIIFGIDPEVLFRWGQSLIKIKTDFKGRLVSLNVPESAPAETPRAIVKCEDSLINLGLNRVDIITKIPSHINENFSSAIAFTKSRLNEFLKIILPNVNDYEWSGVVAFLKYPDARKLPGIKLVTPIYDRIINIPRKDRDLASFQLQHGFAENGFFKNFNITGYDEKLLSVKVPSKPEKDIILKFEDYPTSESGIQMSIDINCQPSKSENDPKSDLEAILAELEDQVKKIGSELNLGELLK